MSIKFNSMFHIALVSIIIMLSGCGENKYLEAEKYQHLESKQSQIQAKVSIDKLEKSLSSGSIRNAKLIDLYAEKVKEKNPELELIVSELKKESSTKGMMFLGLKERFNSNVEALKTAKATFESSKKEDPDYLAALNKYNNVIIPEFQALLGASQTEIYNDALSDIVNTLAELSNGELARVDGKKSEDFYKETGAENKGAGTLLVGNENFGEWKQDSSGNSFWAFYGQMAFLNAMLDLGHRPYYYNSWYSNRPYSSYHDYYGNRYGSQKYRTRTSSLNKKYGFNSKTHKSSSAKSYVAKNPSVTKKFNKFDNQFAKKSPHSKVLSRTSIKPKAKASKISGSKWGNQYSGAKSTKSSGSTRSFKPGK